MNVVSAIAFAWALAALALQVVIARGGGRRDYSARAGSSRRGVLYAFTGAMLPTRKESVRHHPGKFAVGLALHLGVLASLAGVGLLIFGASRVAPALGVIALVTLPGGIFLFVRRLVSPVLRAMSAPDDFIAILAVCLLLALTGLQALGWLPAVGLLAYATLFLLYLPLGKLRHAVFFFVARADLGRRLGFRGTYPPLASSHGE